MRKVKCRSRQSCSCLTLIVTTLRVDSPRSRRRSKRHASSRSVDFSYIQWLSIQYRWEFSAGYPAFLALRAGARPGLSNSRAGTYIRSRGAKRPSRCRKLWPSQIRGRRENRASDAPAGVPVLTFVSYRGGHSYRMSEPKGHQQPYDFSCGFDSDVPSQNSQRQ